MGRMGGREGRGHIDLVDALAICGVGKPHRHLAGVVLGLSKALGQQLIIAGLDVLSVETQRLQSIYQQKLDALGALKKSLLHQAFTGEL